MSFLKRLAAWRRSKAEDRAAIAKAEMEKLRAGEDAESEQAAAMQDVIDAALGVGDALDTR